MEKKYKVKDSEVAKFCKRQKEKFKATKCDHTPNGDGYSTVVVVFPDAES